MAAAATCCTIVFTCLVSLTGLGLSIAEIVMGAIHLADCPVQEKIPIYLVVSGCVGVVIGLGSMVQLRGQRKSSENRNVSEQSAGEKCLGSIMGLLSTFSFAWLICGTVWVFRVSPSFEKFQNGTTTAAVVTGTTVAASSTVAYAAPAESTYCFEPLYKFAMATVLLRYAVTALNILLVFCVCCACCGAIIGAACCAACAGEQEEREEHREQGVTMVGK